MTDLERQLWLGIRRALLLALGAIETFLELPRTKELRHKQRE